MSNTRLQWWMFVVGGHLMTVFFVVGWLCLAQFFPPPSPELTAQQITHRYVENQNGIRLGSTFMMLSFGFWAGWGAVLCSWTRRSVPGGDLLASIQLVSLAVSEMIGVLCAFLWGLAAFRPEQISPEITMTLNDAGWLMFLLPWPPFSAWCIALGVAIFRDRHQNPVMPRWVGYVSLLTGLLFAPAALPLFFKDTHFAYNGVIGMMIPFAVFFIWIQAVTWAMARAIPIQDPDAEPDRTAAVPAMALEGVRG